MITQKRCVKSCKHLQFKGKVVVDIPRREGKNDSALVSFEIVPPEQITVHEEYIVYDTLGIIGSVGGTLGLFIGFSFSGLVSSIMEICLNVFISKRKNEVNPSNDVIKVQPIQLSETNQVFTVEQSKLHDILLRIESLENNSRFAHDNQL